MFKTRAAHPVSDELNYTSSQVSKIARVSLRQLQWWDERKVVSPLLQGHRRIYDRKETVEISIIAELRRKGFSLQKIRRVLRFLHRELGRRLADVGVAAGLQLLTDGKNIYLEDEHERIIDVLKNSQQPMFIVSVSDQVARVDGVSSSLGTPARNPAASASAGVRIRKTG